MVTNGKNTVNMVAYGNNVDVLKRLTNSRLDINASSRYGKTPIHHAAQGNAVKAMKWLQTQGANINMRGIQMVKLQCSMRHKTMPWMQ